MTVTCIRNAPWVVAWDADRRQHYFRNDVDLVFEDNVIVHLDPGYAGHFDHLIDGSTLCVMPGMVNVHTHLQSESIGRGLIEELGNPNLHMTGILDEKSVFVTSGLGEQAGGASAQLVANRASTQNAIAELLKSGATTVVDLAVAYDGWLDLLADTGIRAIAAPMYRDAKWMVPTGHRLDYDWNLEKGRRDFADALEVVDRAERHPSGRLGGMVAPMQVDTCSLELLRDSLAAARARGLKMTVHCSQHIPEFQEMVRRHGARCSGFIKRLARPRYAAGACDLPGSPFPGAMVDPSRSRHSRRNRHLGGSLSGRVFPLRTDDGGRRQLYPQGRQRRHRHRYRAAEHGRGGPHGLDPRARGRPKCAVSGCRSCSMPPRSAAPRRWAATTLAGSPSAPRPTWCCSISTRRACGRCATRFAASSSAPPTAPSITSSSTGGRS